MVSLGERALKPINGISLISYGENLSDIRTIRATISVLERIKLICHGSTVHE